MEGDEMRETTIKVADMSCGHCVATVQTALENLDGVSRAHVSLETKLANVQHDEGLAPAALERAIEDVGFTPELQQ